MGRRSLKASSDGIKKLNAALNSKRMTQTELARRVKCARQTICSLFNDKHIDEGYFLEVCKELGLSAHEVAELEEEGGEWLEIDELVQQVRMQIRDRIHEQCGFMNVLSMTKPIRLGDIYTDVNILETISRHKHQSLRELEAHCLKGKFERLSALEAVDQYRKMVVLGKPGAGKTTFLKRIATQCIENPFHPELVPIFVPLKLFAETQGHPDLLTYVANQWAESNVKEANSKADRLLNEGHALVLLDGLDEVLKADNVRVIEEIRRFAVRFHRNMYVLSCRIATYEFKLEPFSEVEIADFDDLQITGFAKKWFELKNPDLIESFLHLKDSPRIRELASNPLLLTLLCLNFEKSGDLANSRGTLYTEVVHVLLKSWNATKPGIPHEEVYRQLTPDCKEDLLSQLAYLTFEKEQYLFGEEFVKRHIRHYIENLPGTDTNAILLDVVSEAVLKSIEGQHGLLIRRAQGIYAFPHLTFQEYFTARKIAASCSPYAIADETLQGFVQRVSDKRWQEIFLLVAEILPSANCFLQAMKCHIDAMVANDDTLQQFLAWAQTKSASVDASFNAAAVRAFYMYCTPPRDRARKLARALLRTIDCGLNRANILDRGFDLELDRALDRVLSLTIASNRATARALLRTIDCGLDRAVTPAIARNRAIEGEFDRAIEFARDHDSVFCQSLQDLKAQLPDPANITAFQDWWKTQGLNWENALRKAMIKYRNMGHEWHLAPEQLMLLEQYLEATLLLVNCLNNSNISRSVRDEIEETLLWPIAAIETRKVQEAR
jgi:predicted NACHT family NTPase